MQATYRTAMHAELSRQPYRSPGIPASMEPITVPTSALATVKPLSERGEMVESFNAWVRPAMTAVSNPNSQTAQGRDHGFSQRVEFRFHNAPSDG